MPLREEVVLPILTPFKTGPYLARTNQSKQNGPPGSATRARKYSRQVCERLYLHQKSREKPYGAKQIINLRHEVRKDKSGLLQPIDAYMALRLR